MTHRYASTWLFHRPWQCLRSTGCLRHIREVCTRRFPVVGQTLCQRPAQVKCGVLETPEWRITPNHEGERVNSQRWMDGDFGGPLGIIENELRPRVYPSYLRNDWAKDWGMLQSLTPILPKTDAELTITTDTQNGNWTPGPMRAATNGRLLLSPHITDRPPRASS
ncbi:EmbC C-terminal domain-containing protein [Gordonia sp. v-85]|nr:EmbC C-terminal domain-containing protein [Gordonia sp. v-85]